jgi:hypothetical protein
VVVDEVGVIEINTPPFALRGEAAQEQHLRVLRQKRDERMPFHPIRVAFDVLRVQITLHANPLSTLTAHKGRKKTREPQPFAKKSASESESFRFIWWFQKKGVPLQRPSIIKGYETER